MQRATNETVSNRTIVLSLNTIANLGRLLKLKGSCPSANCRHGHRKCIGSPLTGYRFGRLGSNRGPRESVGPDDGRVERADDLHEADLVLHRVPVSAAARRPSWARPGFLSAPAKEDGHSSEHLRHTDAQPRPKRHSGALGSDCCVVANVGAWS